MTSRDPGLTSLDLFQVKSEKNKKTPKTLDYFKLETIKDVVDMPLPNGDESEGTSGGFGVEKELMDHFMFYLGKSGSALTLS